MTRVFHNNEEGFHNWRHTHSDGYILNVRRDLNPEYLMLHRATCQHLRLPNQTDAPWQFTNTWIKVCANDVKSLQQWANQEVKPIARLQECASCQPFKEQHEWT
jgi:hypothetical protein